MQCPCRDLPSLYDEPVTLYFITRIPELRRKIRMLLERCGYAVHHARSLLSVSAPSALALFERRNCEFAHALSRMEREEIRLHLHPQREPLRIDELLYARPISYYMDIVEDRGFFDIISEPSLTSHFQPIIEAKSGAIYGHECLIRGVKLDGGLMYPDELFAKAEKNDLLFMLDRLARENALKTAAVKRLRNKIFINFIPTAVYDPHFCLESTVRWAEQLEFDPSQIVFEVVETQKTADQEHMCSILSYYRDQGFEIALDDVGEGYSSLNMLVSLRPDYIKVDRKIISGIDRNRLQQSVYDGLLQTAREHGIRVLAEGVERQEELEHLMQRGVDYLQGYYFARPDHEPLRRIQAGADHAPA